MDIIEKITEAVKQKFNLPRFEMRYLSITAKEVKTFVKIELLKDKVSKLTEELTKKGNSHEHLNKYRLFVVDIESPNLDFRITVKVGNTNSIEWFSEDELEIV